MQRSHCLIAAGLLAAATASFFAFKAFNQDDPATAATPANAQTDADAAPDHVPTHFTEPKRNDDTIIYMQAVNQWAKQIPNENNFAIAVANAMHPDDWSSPEYRKAVYDHWGLTPPPASDTMFRFGDTFEAIRKHALNTKPWAADEHPSIAAAVHDNQAALHTLMDSLSRTQWFWPCIDMNNKTDGVLWESELPAIGITLRTVALLGAQAMQALDHGDPAQALACLKQANTLGQRTWSPQGPIVEQRAALSICLATTKGLQSVVASKHMDAETLEQINAYLKQQHPLKSFPSHTTGMERWGCMDFWDLLVSGRYTFYDILADAFYNQPHQPYLKRVNLTKHGLNRQAGIDAINQHFDTLASITKSHATFEQQHQQLVAFENKQFAPLEDETSDVLSVVMPGVKPSKSFLFEAKDTQTYVDALLAKVAAAPTPNYETKWQLHTQIRMLELITALRASQLKTGLWPASLEDAVAAGICPAELIQDPFKPEQNLQYRLTEGGFDLWAVSADLDDDQGLDKKQSQAKSNDPDDEGDWVIQFRLAH